MATTTTILSADEIVANPDSPDPFLRLYRVAVNVQGTYVHATPPNFNFYSDDGGLKKSRFGCTAVTVQSALALHDRFDGNAASATAGRMTPLNSGITLSNVNAGCTGDKVAFLIAANGAANGLVGSGAEVADGTNVSGIYQLLLVASLSAQ